MFQLDSRPNGDTLIVPIAADLRRNQHGTVVLGPLTTAACDLALQIAGEARNPVILTTASRASGEYGGAMMGEIMKSYLSKKLPPNISQNQDISFYLARWFTTMGEVLAAAEYIQWMYGPGDDDLHRLVFAVKAFYQPRLEMLVKRIFSFKGIVVPVEYRTHECATDSSMERHEKIGLWINKRQLEWRIQSGEITRRPEYKRS